ncbi:MAG: DUF3494 domain-containing protein [Bacteroidales bacterium]|nr:DUF3494 domain-containing protein [Bacteroidales bacterium]
MKLKNLLSTLAIAAVVLMAGCNKDDDNIDLDIIRPTILTKNPANNVTDVVLNKIVAVTFSEEMNPLTLSTTTFTINQGTIPVEGTVSYSGTTATFTPSVKWVSASTYTAKITTGAENLSGIALEADNEWSFTTGSTSSSMSTVDLGTSVNYVILAKTKISTVPTSDITGDLGLSPAAASYITGFDITKYTGYAESAQVDGQIFAADMDAIDTPMMLTTAVENMITAYNDAAGRPVPDFLELGTGNIGGKTLAPGLYKWTNTVTLPTDVTISGGADDIWIFQISGDLTMSADVNVILEGGAQAKNIFWQVAGEASFGASSHFEGIILSMTAITFKTSASFNGRALAQTAVVLDGNIVVEP